MIKALLLIFEPTATWERILRARRGAAFIFGFYLFPMLVVTSVVEGYGLYHWGQARDFGVRKTFLPGEAVLFELLQFVLYLGVVFVGAKLLKALGETFHGRHNFTQAFAAVTYGLGPLFLLHLLDGLRDISPWVPWAIGILLSLGVLYQGVPRMMDPDPSHAFGLYLTGSLLLLLISGLVRFITAWYLQGKFVKLEDLLATWGGQLPLH